MSNAFTSIYLLAAAIAPIAVYAGVYAALFYLVFKHKLVHNWFLKILASVISVPFVLFLCLLLALKITPGIVQGSYGQWFRLLLLPLFKFYHVIGAQLASTIWPYHLWSAVGLDGDNNVDFVIAIPLFGAVFHTLISIAFSSQLTGSFSIKNLIKLCGIGALAYTVAITLVLLEAAFWYLEYF